MNISKTVHNYTKDNRFIEMHQDCNDEPCLIRVSDISGIYSEDIGKTSIGTGSKLAVTVTESYQQVIDLINKVYAIEIAR